MSAVNRLDLIPVEDYLAGELDSPVKHEYVGGLIYPMAGARKVHDLIAGNSFGALRGRTRRHCYQAFDSATRICLRFPTHVRFYYPDASVCWPDSAETSFQCYPVIVVEVLESLTRRIDEIETNDAYQSIPSLDVYILVEQKMPAIVAFRRTERGFVREVYTGLDAVIPLPEIDTELPMGEIYEAVQFSPERDEGIDA